MHLFTIKTTTMKRRGFINLAVLLPFAGSFKSIFTDNELLHFDLSELEPLLKNITPEDQAKANLLRRNLAFDVQYVLERVKNFKDPEAIKSLALEADRKFHADNKMNTKDFSYQPISISALEGFRNITVANSKEFDGMMKDIREQLTSLQTSAEPYVRDVVKKLTVTGAQKYVRKTPGGPNEIPGSDRAAEKAKEAQECARTWSLVGSIVSLVILVIVAIVVAVFTFGASGNGMAMSVIGSIVGASIAASQVISVTNNNIRIDNMNFGLRDTKVDLGKANLDSLLKCSTSAAAVTAAMSYFGKTAYPANPLAGSLTVSLIGIVAKLPGFNACS
jgi:hypothetical protein